MSITMLGCGVPEYKALNQSGFFPLDSLIDNNISQLANNRKALYKEAWIDDGYEVTTIPSDSLDWGQELGILYQANLNKPSYKGGYTKKIEDFNGNKIISYNIKKDGSMDIESFYIYYSNHLDSIKASVVTNNALYDMKRTFKMLFNDQNKLKSYQIEGFQKLTFGDPTSFKVKGKIIDD
ncbi:MAG TPA: hypothetical protein ACFCUD_10790 [Cyclobacteriaceae bacterium]